MVDINYLFLIIILRLYTIDYKYLIIIYYYYDIYRLLYSDIKWIDKPTSWLQRPHCMHHPQEAPGPHDPPMAPSKPSGSRCDGLNQPHLGVTQAICSWTQNTTCLVVKKPWSSLGIIGSSFQISSQLLVLYLFPRMKWPAKNDWNMGASSMSATHLNYRLSQLGFLAASRARTSCEYSSSKPHLCRQDRVYLQKDLILSASTTNKIQ